MPHRWTAIALLAALVVVAAAASRAPVDIDATPNTLMLRPGSSPTSRLHVAVHRADRRAVGVSVPVLGSTAGRVDGLVAAGPGEFTATLTAPEERFPQIAVVTAADTCAVALGGPPEVASTAVSYAAAVDLRGRTEPRASMQVKIAGRTFGPVRADAAGHFVLPVEVPPGERFGLSISTDELGNASRSKVNLYLPEVVRLHGYVYPTSVVVGGEDPAWIFITTVRADGAPEDVPLVVRARRGQVDAPTRIARGLYRVTYRAPTALGDGRDTVDVRRRRDKSGTELAVELLAGAPKELVFDPWDARAPADGKTPLRFDVAVRDRFGNPASGHAVSLGVGGVDVQAVETAPGRYTAELAPRDRVATEPGRWRLMPLAARCPRPRLIADDAHEHIFDRRGLPCSVAYRLADAVGKTLATGTTDKTGAVSGERVTKRVVDGSATLLVDEAEPSCVRVPVRKDNDALVLATPLAADVALRWQVVPPVRIDIVEIGRKAGRLLLRITLRGEAMRRDRLRIEATSGPVEVLRESKEALDVSVPYLNVPVQVAATDIPTGVSGWLRAQ